MVLQGGQNHLLDTPPLAGNVEVLLRSIDLITTARPKALLWQARITTTPNASREESAFSSDTGTGGTTAFVLWVLNTPCAIGCQNSSVIWLLLSGIFSRFSHRHVDWLGPQPSRQRVWYLRRLPFGLPLPHRSRQRWQCPIPSVLQGLAECQIRQWPLWLLVSRP